MVARDNRMNIIETTFNSHISNLASVLNNDTVREIRLAGRINVLIYRANDGLERNGYVITGIDNWNKDDHPDQAFMRALQQRRGGNGQNWYNVPFV